VEFILALADRVIYCGVDVVMMTSADGAACFVEEGGGRGRAAPSTTAVGSGSVAGCGGLRQRGLAISSPQPFSIS
jgi:hypothetical protein